jgi:hypothetical protein
MRIGQVCLNCYGLRTFSKLQPPHCSNRYPKVLKALLIPNLRIFIPYGSPNLRVHQILLLLYPKASWTLESLHFNVSSISVHRSQRHSSPIPAKLLPVFPRTFLNWAWAQLGARVSRQSRGGDRTRRGRRCGRGRDGARTWSAPRRGWARYAAEERDSGVSLATALAPIAVYGGLELPWGAERPCLALVRIQVLHVPRDGRETR